MNKVENTSEFDEARKARPVSNPLAALEAILRSDDETARETPELDKPADEAPKAAPRTAKAPPLPAPSVEDEDDRDEEQPPARPRRRTVRLALFAALPLVLLIGGYFYVTGGSAMESDNAYVRADTVSVSTDVAGIVKSVAVQDNQHVSQGQVLYTLDPEPFEYALAKAAGQLGIARAQLSAQKASYEQIEAEIKKAEMDIDFYQKDFDRKTALAKQDFASKAAYDESLHNLQDAQQSLASLKTQLAQAAAKLDGHPEWPVEKLSGYRYALAERDEAARELAHATVRAPFDGIVTNVPSLQIGQSMSAGQAAFNLVATDHVWVESNPKETDLTWVQPGQPVTVTVDTYPGVTWQGKVASISPASASSFSLLPAQNTSGNWVKVVQRIPLRVRIETPGDKPQLRAGMSAEIAVDTGHARGLPSFLTGWFASDESHG